MSSRAINDNNLTGYAVYEDTSEGETFTSKERCIMETAKLLKTQYLDSTGAYFYGLSIYDVNNKYSQKNGEPNLEWNTTINNIAFNILNVFQ